MPVVNQFDQTATRMAAVACPPMPGVTAFLGADPQIDALTAVLDRKSVV